MTPTQLKAWFTAVQSFVKLEPSTVQAILQSILALGLAFGWFHWTTAQTGAVVGMVAVLLAMFVRTQVVSLYGLRELVNADNATLYGTRVYVNGK